MTPALLSLGTALPPHVLEQTDAQDLYQAQPGTDQLNARLLRTEIGRASCRERV